MNTQLSRRGLFKLGALSAVAYGFLGSTIQKEKHLTYQLGKLPARPHYGLKLRDYVTPSQLPTPPDIFGHEALVGDWQMLGNDELGDCAIAGPMHAEMLWNAMGNRSVNIDRACTVAEYSEITHYDPKAYDPWTGTNPTDNGSDVQQVAEFWRTTGMKDADGKRHKIACYLALEPGNLPQAYLAMYLFGCIGIGIACPEEYQMAFQNGQVWDAIPNPNIEGGHYVLGVGRRPAPGSKSAGGAINVVTWGRTQLFTPKGYQQFNDETFVMLSEEMLINSRSLEGFDDQQLIADMAALAELGPDQPQNDPCDTLPLNLAELLV